MERLQIGISRLLSVADREEIVSIRTLEMKISDGGPTPKRVEPHILGLAGIELLERRRLSIHRHPLTKTLNWYAPSRLSPDHVKEKLDAVARVHADTVSPTFTAALGDPLEISIFRCLQEMRQNDRRVRFYGSFDLSKRLDNGRFSKKEPPTSYNDAVIDGPPDFVLFHPDSGETFMIECKNHREWIYPSSDNIKTIVRKAIAADCTPIIIARRMPFITKNGLCAPAGIIAHETYHQLYPETDNARALAELARQKRGLGYSDIKVSEEPLDRTRNFFHNSFPKIAQRAAELFQTNKEPLSLWANGEISWRDVFDYLNRGTPYNGIDANMEF